MSQWPSKKFHLNPFVSDSGFAKINGLDLDCKVSSRIPLNISTTKETLQELSNIYQPVILPILSKLQFFNILAATDVYIPEKCLQV